MLKINYRPHSPPVSSQHIGKQLEERNKQFGNKFKQLEQSKQALSSSPLNSRGSSCLPADLAPRKSRPVGARMSISQLITSHRPDSSYYHHLYRTVHQDLELGLQERETAAHVVESLRRLTQLWSAIRTWPCSISLRLTMRHTFSTKTSPHIRFELLSRNTVYRITGRDYQRLKTG